VILDGVKQKQYKSVGGLTFSPDSKRFAYCAEENNREFAVVDGEERKRYDDSPSRLVFSPDSKHIAYCVSSFAYGTCVFVLDGTETHHTGSAKSYAPVFSPDSRHVAYSVREAGGTVMYLDGKPFLTADEVPLFGLAFAADSGKLVFPYRRGQKWFVAFGQDTYGPYDRVDPLRIEISPDSRRITIPAYIGGEWFLFCGKEKHGPYGFAPHGTFSPDGQSIAWVGGQEKDVRVYRDGQLLATVQRVGWRNFSADGQHFVFGGQIDDRDGRYVLFVDGVQTNSEGEMTDYLYSPDSQRLVAVMLKDAKKRIDEGGRQSRPHDGIGSPCFSPDSKHLAYVATDGGRNVVVIDGEETFSFFGTPFERVVFSKSNHLFGVAFVLSQDDQRALEGREPSWENHVKWVGKTRLVLFEVWREPRR